MAKYEKEVETDIITELLNVTKTNLENKIKLFENELINRQRIFDKVMTNLGINKIRLEDRLHRFRYIGFQGREMMIRDLSHLDFKIVSEWTEFFRDMLHLKEKLQEARGELNVEGFKNRLIDR